jgi:hypothetical protein
VWVTITRVRANISSDASETDSSWVDLVNLQNSPRQIDLLTLDSPTATTCLLNQLGSTNGLPPGRYQQIRFYLLANNATGVTVTPDNQCASVNAFNCVDHSVLGLEALQLSSQAQTGIKVPPGQIAGGAIDLQAGQPADINIEFNTCKSILRQGNGQFRMKPTLLAGAVSVNTAENSLSGRVIDQDTSLPIANAVILLEQPDTDNVDRVVRAAMSSSSGQFIFCPLPSGNYDVVVAATATSGSPAVTTTYNATVAFDVPLGAALGDIGLVPELAGTTGSTDPATIEGQVTSAGTGGATITDVTVSALQDASANGTTRHVTIPVFAALSQPPVVATADDSSCPAGTSCATYSLQVPASNPRVGTFSSGSITYADPAPAPVTYQLNGVAASCTSSDPTSPILVPAEVTPGATTTVSTVMAFSGCTASSP